MTSAIDETKPAESSALDSSEMRDNFLAAKNEILALQSYTSTHLFGDGSDLTSTLSAVMTAAQNTYGVVELVGTFIFTAQLPQILGFSLDIRRAKLIGNVKTGIGLLVGSGGRLIGGGTGEVHFRPMRRYRLSSITSNGSQVVATILQADLDDPALGPHSFAAPNEVYFQNVVLTSGTLNNTINRNVASVTSNTITVTTTAVVDSSVTYPRDRLDGQGRSIYPVIYLSRTGSFNDFAAIISGNGEINGVKFKWGAAGGIWLGNANGAIVKDNVIWETAADAIHITNESRDCLIEGNRIYGAGDDGIAAISYKKDGGQCHDLRIINNVVQDSLFNGRGLTLSGGHDIYVHNFHADDMYGAGILLEGSSYGAKNITIDGFTIRTCGSSGTVPNGWVTSAYAAMQISGSTGMIEDIFKNIRISNGYIFNSRYRSLAISNGVNVDIDRVYASEADDIGFLLEGRDSRVRMTIDRSRQNAISLATSGGVGKNEVDAVISNPNRGTRRWIASIGVSGGTITGVWSPGQTTGLSAGNVIIIQGVTSAYSSTVNDVDEVRADFAINGTWTLATVDATGFTITGTGLADTNHAKCISYDQPCPQAYLSLASGYASNIDAISIDSDTITDKKLVIRADIRELLWPIERTIDDTGAGTNTYKIDAVVDSLTNVTMDGDSMLYSPPVLTSTRISTDAGRTILPREIKRGAYIRESITAPVTDTLPTAALLVALLRGRTMATSAAFEWSVLNLSAHAVTLALGAGMTNTLSVSLVVAANTEVSFGLAVTNATPGSEVVDIRRRFTRSGISA